MNLNVTLINLLASISIIGALNKASALSSSGASPVNLPVVAVIDTGCDIHHPLLKDQIWTNLGESGTDRYGRDKSNNNIDDDMNGFIDDIHGWNFLANNNDLSDHIGHGTHVSGIIVSKSKSLKTQHAPVKIMVLKFFDAGASGEKVLKATADAINYATKMGVTIINYSAGGRTSSPQEYKALVRAKNANIIIVAAAGNEHTDNDLFSFFPASYRLSNIVAVSATDEDGRLLSSSNYGKETVTAHAPGKDIVSSLPGGKMGKMTGTSQATAMVTAQMISEKFRLASIQRGIDEIEKAFAEESDANENVKNASNTSSRQILFSLAKKSSKN